MTNLNIKSCNAYLIEELERQIRLTQGVLDAVQEREYRRARLFSGSAERCANDVSSFLNSMIEEEKAKK